MHDGGVVRWVSFRSENFIVFLTEGAFTIEEETVLLVEAFPHNDAKAVVAPVRGLSIGEQAGGRESGPVQKETEACPKGSGMGIGSET